MCVLNIVSHAHARTQARNCIKTVLAAAAGVSTDVVFLELTAGSVVVTYEILLASAAAAQTSRDGLVAGPLASSTTLQTALTNQFDADGVTTAPAVEVQALEPPQTLSVADTAASPAPPPSEEEEGSMAIIIIVAAACGLVLGVAVLVCLCKSRRKSDEAGAHVFGKRHKVMQPTSTVVGRAGAGGVHSSHVSVGFSV